MNSMSEGRFWNWKKLMPNEKNPETLCLKSYSDYHYVDTKDILYLQADNNTTDFVMKDGTTISAYKTLKTYQQQLPKNFVRIHQSYILNTDYVSRINYGKSLCTLKLRKVQLPFSKIVSFKCRRFEKGTLKKCHFFGQLNEYSQNTLTYPHLLCKLLIEFFGAGH